MADLRIPADVNEAVYRLVHDFGAQRLAAKTGTSPGVILNKANPHESSHHKTTLADAVVWSQIASDDRIAEAFCQALDGTFVPLRDMHRQSDSALIDLILERDEALGEYAETMRNALDDGKVTRSEFNDLSRDGFAVVAALLTLLYRLEGMIRD